MCFLRYKLYTVDKELLRAIYPHVLCRYFHPLNILYEVLKFIYIKMYIVFHFYVKRGLMMAFITCQTYNLVELNTDY
jgi:hypothetical protein